jgi:hypothetical protein
VSDRKRLCSGTLGTILPEKSRDDSTKPVESNSIVLAEYELYVKLEYVYENVRFNPSTTSNCVPNSNPNLLVSAAFLKNTSPKTSKGTISFSILILKTVASNRMLLKKENRTILYFP